MKLLIQLSVLLVLLFAVNCKPANDDDYDPSIVGDDPTILTEEDYADESEDEDNDKELEEPKVLSSPENLIVKINDTVKLPCESSNADFFTTMWKINNDILYQDKLLLSKANNKYELDGRSLVIKRFNAGDVGDYTCSILSQQYNPQVTHTVKLVTGPTITKLRTINGKNTFTVGEEFTLECEATGLPAPRITWSLNGVRFMIPGGVLTVSDIKPTNAGVYQCLADNNITNPVHAPITININQKPDIKMDRRIFRTTEYEFTTEVICTVESRPQAQVTWLRDGKPLASSEGHIKLRQKNHEYRLVITDTREADFGDYMCVARNDLGETVGKVHVSNRPSKPVFVHGGHEQHHVRMEWKLESIIPVSKYEVDYRKMGDTEWNKLHPEVTNSDGNMYSLKHIFEHLHEGTYQVQVRAKNNNGWGEHSEVSTFKSNLHHHHKSEPVIEAKDSGTALLPCLALLCATLLAIINLRH